jgi:hypothetical protein
MKPVHMFESELSCEFTILALLPVLAATRAPNYLHPRWKDSLHDLTHVDNAGNQDFREASYGQGRILWSYLDKSLMDQ